MITLLSKNTYTKNYGLISWGFKAYVVFMALFFTPSTAKADTYKILAFGDSLTAGYGLDQGKSYPDKLQEKLLVLGYDVKIINAGVSGETTTGGLNRLDWTMQHNPDLVVLALGANDALRFIDPDLTYRNLDSMIVKIKDRGAKVLLLGMVAPRNGGAEFTQKFDAIYPRLAKVHDIPLYPFILEGVATKPDLNIHDGVHPNEKGTEIIANNVLPYLVDILDSKSE
jgi:acyl-CoA thioesterase-1